MIFDFGFTILDWRKGFYHDPYRGAARRITKGHDPHASLGCFAKVKSWMSLIWVSRGGGFEEGEIGEIATPAAQACNDRFIRLVEGR